MSNSTSSSLRKSLASICHELLHPCNSATVADGIDTTSRNSSDTINSNENDDSTHFAKSNNLDIHSISSSCKNTWKKSIKNNLKRNPYAIFTLEPSTIASNLSVCIDKVQDIQNRASLCVLEDPTYGTFGTDFISHSSDIRIPTSNMLLNLYKQSHSIIRTKSSCLYISTGSSHLDQFLKKMYYGSIPSTNSRKRTNSNEEGNGRFDESNFNGGLSLGKVTQFVGPCAAGKTQLALSLASHAILFHESKCKVYYMVGGGGNSSLVTIARRFKSIASALLTQKQEQADVENGRDRERYDEVMHHFELLPVYDGYMLLDKLYKIESDFRNAASFPKNESSLTTHKHLVVIDSIVGSISSLIWGEGDGGVGASLLNEIGLSLRRISRVEFTKGIPSVAVVVTNDLITNRSTLQQSAALGDTWRAPDLTVVLDTQSLESGLITYPVGSPVVVDKIITARNHGNPERFEKVEFRIGSSGVTNI